LRTQLTHALGRFCFGAFGGWPVFAPADLKRTVELINTAVAGVRRRVDWVHIPTLDTSDQAFYAPLANLDAKGAYLPWRHRQYVDVESAIRHSTQVPTGVRVGCVFGFGRTPPEQLPQILHDHLTAVKIAGLTAR
jgi:hypothetical protein